MIRAAVVGALACLVAALPVRAAPAAFICPMHVEVERSAPGRCPICGMALVPAGDPFADYPVRLTTTPSAPVAGADVALALTIVDPRTGAPVRELEIVHEKPLHLFVVSEALDHLDHLHPSPAPDGRLVATTRLPSPGRYLVVAEFVPRGGMPQSVARTLLTRGYHGLFGRAHLGAEPRRQTLGGVTLALETPQATLDGPMELVFHVAGAALEPWLGAAAHLLVVSEDLADVVHSHADLDAGRLRFTVHLARPGPYRVWVQFQSAGRVFTAPFVVTAERPEERLLSR